MPDEEALASETSSLSRMREKKKVKPIAASRKMTTMT
jgi:hypothetical protein